MRQFGAFVKKEFFHILRDKRTLLILLGMPVVQIVLFGFAISVEINNINIAVVAPERSETVREIAERIDANPYFTVTEWLDSAADIDSRMQREKIDMAIVFADNFDNDPAMQFVVDAANPNSATIEAAYLSVILKDYFTQKFPTASQAQPIQPNIRMLYNPQMKSSYNFVPGIMGLVFILICALMTSISIVREKERGTMEVLLVSPVKPIYIIFAKMIPYFTISCISLVVILLLSYYVLGVPLAGSIFWLCVISLIYIFLSLTLGLLISTLVRTQVTAMLISIMGLMLPVIMLSGMIFPIDNLPLPLRALSNIVPAKWYISAARKLMVEGLTFRYIATDLAILCGMSLVLITVSLKKFKNRLE